MTGSEYGLTARGNAGPGPEAGPIAPGFGQPGLGLQYQLVSSLLAGDPATANVMWLISNGYLRSLN